ncbi:hypothetical protein Pla175_44290 [Pirellulimonas nuda]|uniref:Uncharacterized protein n=1 Tax=Pirellulimonas nuda TaxID=2528009 RepID=A0A518DHR1_9BACT|nr:hypothetical protein Pla175_44290 [Pirellulimonas nuda]
MRTIIRDIQTIAAAQIGLVRTIGVAVVDRASCYACHLMRHFAWMGVGVVRLALGARPAPALVRCEANASKRWASRQVSARRSPGLWS